MAAGARAAATSWVHPAADIDRALVDDQYELSSAYGLPFWITLELLLARSQRRRVNPGK
jgi:hypothetical protein